MEEKEKKGKERKGKEGKGKKTEGKEREEKKKKGEERKGKEREGKKRLMNKNNSFLILCYNFVNCVFVVNQRFVSEFCRRKKEKKSD